MSVLQEKFKVIADKIRECLGTTDLIKPNDFADKVAEVYEKGKSEGGNTDAAYQQGKADERTAFWNVYQNGGERENYYRAFANSEWTDEIYNPIFPIVVESGASYGTQIYYNNASIIDTKIPITILTALNQTFDGARNLVIIPSLTVGENTTFSNPFRGCISLVDVGFNGTIGQDGLSFLACTKLNKASHIRVINCASSTADITITFSLAAVNAAFETSEGANDGSTSTEWLALVATKPNVTVELA